jgi:hypothetical protein
MEWLFLAKSGVYGPQNLVQVFPINCTVLAVDFQEFPAWFGVVEYNYISLL